MTEPRATTADEADPTEDTPESEPDETDEETPEAGAAAVDWEARYREAEKALGRQGAELAIYRRGEAPDGYDEGEDDEDESDDDEPVDRGGPDESVAALAGDSWALAEARYGPEAVDAYSAAYRILGRAQTPADVIAAFEAYHEVRSGEAQQAPEGGKPAKGKPKSRSEAVEPKVDLNRADASPDLTDLENQFAEAKGEGNLAKFVHAATTAAGFGRKPAR